MTVAAENREYRRGKFSWSGRRLCKVFGAC